MIGIDVSVGCYGLKMLKMKLYCSWWDVICWYTKFWLKDKTLFLNFNIVVYQFEY